MRIALLKKRVVTESGVLLGVVHDVEVLWPDLRIVLLCVRPKMTAVLGKEFLVSPDQIVRIEEKAIVVRDDVVSYRRTGVLPSALAPRMRPKTSLERGEGV